jgi:signal transduction histidine kinase
LAEYLSSWGQEFLSRAGIVLRLEIPRDLTDFPMDSERRHALFLAVREALHNIMKHSGAKEAWLRLRSTPQTLTVVVEDTGCGFDPASVRRGDGLGNYEARMLTCGGSVTLTTAPGEGTRLEFRLPLPPRNAPPAPKSR